MGVKRILVCEDEKLVADRLCRFIKEVVGFEAELQRVATLNQAFEVLSEHRIDLLFLDLNLHGKDGLDLLKRLTSEAFHTIIVSAYTEKAIDAYEYGVLDFVGKPFTKQRLAKALGRFGKDTAVKGRGIKYIAIKSRQGIDFVPVENVDFIRASGIYSELVMLGGAVKVYDKPMNRLLKLLPERFIRVHKSYAVPLPHIKGIFRRKANTYDILLTSGQKIPVSRGMRKALIHRISKI